MSQDIAPYFYPEETPQEPLTERVVSDELADALFRVLGSRDTLYQKRKVWEHGPMVDRAEDQHEANKGLYMRAVIQAVEFSQQQKGRGV